MWSIVRKLQDEVNRIVESPAFKEKMSVLQVDPKGSTSEQFTLRISSELANWRAVAKARNIEPAN